MPVIDAKIAVSSAAAIQLSLVTRAFSFSNRSNGSPTVPNAARRRSFSP